MTTASLLPWRAMGLLHQLHDILKNRAFATVARLLGARRHVFQRGTTTAPLPHWLDDACQPAPLAIDHPTPDAADEAIKGGCASRSIAVVRDGVRVVVIGARK